MEVLSLIQSITQFLQIGIEKPDQYLRHIGRILPVRFLQLLYANYNLINA